MLFKRVFKAIDPIIKSLNITDEVIQHFAIWIVKAKTFQIKQRSQDKIKFYLACFTYHYYYLRQDALILSMIKGVKEQLNKIDKEMEAITSRTTQIYGQLTETLHASRSNFKRCVSMVEKEAYSKLSIEEKLYSIN